MKTTKRLALILVALVMAMTVVLAACTHVCGHVCPDCGKCTDANCKDPVCADKCPGHSQGNEYKDGDYWVNDTKNYTYRMGPQQLPTSWNYHTYEENMSTYILDYTSDALYTMDYNEDYTKFKIVPSMASGDPVDVSAQYVGQFGIKAGETGKAYKIPLKTTLKFDDGTAINANTFVRSMQNLLNPTAKNYRADNMWKSGTLKIYGSEAYAKQNSYALGEFVSENYGANEYVNPSSFVATSDGLLQVDGKDIIIDLTSGGNWGRNGLAAYANAGYFTVSLVMDEETGRVKIFSTSGEWILTRSLEMVTIPATEEGEEDDEDYEFYDLDGNKLPQRYVNEAGTAWVYLDKDGEIVEAWAGCRPQNIYIDAYQALLDAADDNGWVKLTADLVVSIQTVIAHLQGGTLEQYIAACAADDKFVGKDGDINYALVEWEEMAFLGQDWGSYEFKDVGFFAASDTELVIVLVNAMEDNFYLRYELCTSFFLVNNALYEQNISTTGGVYSNSYGTSVATYSGYGPYKLVEYLADSKIKLERNPYWHGYYELEHKGQYMTTAIEYKVVADDNTRKEMFLKGELDSYGLRAEDMEDYITSKYTYLNDSESTWFIAMNPSVANYEEQQALATPATAGNTVVKTPLAIDEFRQALSYSLDRTAYILACNPTSGVGKSLMSVMQFHDPENGTSYRSTDEAKDAILEFWGLADAWGPGKEYETRDEAIESITGYDPAGAKVLFTTAFNKAKELGYITDEMISSGKWEVQLMIGSSSWSSAYSTKSFDFFNANWTKAVEGTPFEGHLSIVKSGALGQAYGDELKAGHCDMLFGVGFGGSMFDPFSFMDVFTGTLAYDAFTDKKTIDMDVEIDGKVLRASLYDWVSKCLQGDEIVAKVVGTDGNVTSDTVKISAGAAADVSLRLKIMAKAETAIMELSNMIPLMTDASASLRCMRVVYKTEDYILGAGRGGVQYYTYTHDDAEFAAFVAAQGGTLNYKVTE